MGMNSKSMKDILSKYVFHTPVFTVQYIESKQTLQAHAFAHIYTCQVCDYAKVLENMRIACHATKPT